MVTRPDISTAVNILSRKNEKLLQKDWKAVKRMISYLNYTNNLNLIINMTKTPILELYTGSDWEGDIQSRRSTSGNLFLLGKNPIHWMTMRQSCNALSRKEVQYISAANASQELMWILKLLEKLNLQQKFPVTMHEDNLSCTKILESKEIHTKN